VTGDFRRGDVVEVRTGEGQLLARGQAQYNVVEAGRIAGRHSREIESILGFRYGEAMIHRDDLVLLEAVDLPGEASA
jgi:glutamate 5-kinase